MFAPTRILVPVDFSGASDAAFHRAADLAGRTGAELHVLHVVPGISPEVSFADLSKDDRAFYRRLFEQADGDLTARFEQVDTQGTRTKRVISKGAPSHVVLDYAAREGADLIVMGTRGRTGFRRFFLGSVAGEVLRRTEVPVMVVPEAVSSHRPLRLILAPTDFSGASRWALAVAAELAALYGADLDLLHALEPDRFVESVTGAEIAASLFPELRTEVEHHLETLATDAGLLETMADGVDTGAPVEGGGRVLARIGYHIANGRAAEAIADLARTRGADAIVMAKHGLHGVERLLLGSVTERVCRLASCAVLVIPIDGQVGKTPAP